MNWVWRDDVLTPRAKSPQLKRSDFFYKWDLPLLIFSWEVVKNAEDTPEELKVKSAALSSRQSGPGYFHAQRVRVSDNTARQPLHE